MGIFSFHFKLMPKFRFYYKSLITGIDQYCSECQALRLTGFFSGFFAHFPKWPPSEIVTYNFIL